MIAHLWTRRLLEHGRPTSLRIGGLRVPRFLPGNVCGQATRCLVRAWIASEGPDAIPIDQVVVASSSVPALMLPLVELRILVENEKGERIREMEIRVGS